MKKIAILTFSYGTNYGGTLQCLALYKTLKKMGYEDIEIINYIPKNFYSLKSKFLAGIGLTKNINSNIRSLNSIVHKSFIKFKNVDKLIKKFEDFRQTNMKISEIVTKEQFENKLTKYDAILVGSDQVWSVQEGLTEAREIYYLMNCKEYKNKRISYAACSGVNKYFEADKEQLKKALNDFDYISVRNNHTFSLVKEIIGKEVMITSDPTILYDFKPYIKNLNKEKYILVYILGSEINGGHEQVIKKVKEKYGQIKIVSIGIPFAGSGRLQFYDWADENIFDASPEDWISYIKNAEFVYTDSYHGVIFSMKFNKPFLSYYSEKARASRFIDLASRYEVQDYIVESVEDMKKKNSLNKNLDYTKVDKMFEEHKKISLEFLRKALES